MRENLFTAKASANMTPTQYLSVRYGRNTNSQVYGATTRRVSESWGDSENTFNSINMNHNWVLGGSKLNEFVFQYADFANNVAARTGARAGDVPERRHHRLQHATRRRRPSRRSTSSATTSHGRATGMGGLGHDFKAGVNFIHEPRLYVTFSSGSTDYAYIHLDLNPHGPISADHAQQARLVGEPADGSVRRSTSRTTGASTTV